MLVAESHELERLRGRRSHACMPRFGSGHRRSVLVPLLCGQPLSGAFQAHVRTLSQGVDANR